MKIQNNFKIKDEVSGLEISVSKGKLLNVLRIDIIGDPIQQKGRCFYFDLEGNFDGTSSHITKTVVE